MKFFGLFHRRTHEQEERVAAVTQAIVGTIQNPCATCRHCEPSPLKDMKRWEYAHCLRPMHKPKEKLPKERILSLVSGLEPPEAKPRVVFCDMERSIGGCGEGGKFWEQKA